MNVQIIERINKQKAIETAINLSDHSKEIIVREIESITDYTHEFENID